MSRSLEKQKAICLRKKGLSYSQIKEFLGISKSTLSSWLKDFPLSEERIKELKNSEQKIERCRETKRKKKEARLNDFYNEEKKKILPLSKKELYLAGFFLYWGEGAKNDFTKISISNTDPAVIKFFMSWLEECWNIKKEKSKINLHLYKDMDINKEINFWTEVLEISKLQFDNPYIKDSFSKNINHKKGFGHGTCNLRIGDARLSERVLMGLKVLNDYYIK
ncbi:MAG: helix-turn-helix domain-containing protein [Candidatus Paceibacterota bacterium]